MAECARDYSDLFSKRPEHVGRGSEHTRVIIGRSMTSARSALRRLSVPSSSASIRRGYPRDVGSDSRDEPTFNTAAPAGP